MAALKRIPNAAAAEAAAAIAANNTTTIYAKRNTTNLINNITTTTTNTTLLSNNSSSRRLLMKNQLHLNLNVIETLNVDNDDNELNSTMETGVGTFGLEQPPLTKLEWDGVNIETVTTVPQQQQQPQPHEPKKLLEEEYSKYEAISVGQSSTVAGAAATVRRMAAASSLSSSPSSLLHSSSTALAKFNRIIDSTMPVTNYYMHEQEQQQRQMHTDDPASTAVLSEALQQRLALVYPGIVSTDSQTKKINFITTKTAAATAVAAGTAQTTTHAAKPKAKVKGKSVASQDRLRSTRRIAVPDETVDAAATASSNDDNQMKRNDVHYLLKQLNSFSDIEEIEIVDMEQRQRQLDEQQQRLSVQQQQQLAQHLAQEQQQQQQFMGAHGGGGGVDNKSQSPTAQSLVIISPSSLSHKGIRRYASLHQQQCSNYYYTLDSDEAIDNVEQQQQYLLQQFDDYLFQSCHYLETNSFAANYRTAMVESSSHEFRPSTTTPSTTATTTRTGTSGAASISSEQSLELHETEPPSVICKATPPPTTESAVSQVPIKTPPATVTSPPSTSGINVTTSVTLPLSPPKRYGMQARLTSSGVQTELTAANTITTESSLPKSTSSSASSSEDQRRRAPFFKCCYTPIDRWREKRNAAHTAAAAQKRSSRRSAGKPSESEVGIASPVSGNDGRGSSTVGVVSQQHTRKNGHAV